MNQEQFIRECILENLELDHEEYEMLESGVKEACGDNQIEYTDEVFRKQLKSLLDNGDIMACFYDHESKKLSPAEYDPDSAKEYLFCIKE